MWKAAAQWLQPNRSPAASTPHQGQIKLRAASIQPRPASASLGQLADVFWLAGHSWLAFTGMLLTQLEGFERRLALRIERNQYLEGVAAQQGWGAAELELEGSPSSASLGVRDRGLPPF